MTTLYLAYDADYDGNVEILGLHRTLEAAQQAVVDRFPESKDMSWLGGADRHVPGGTAEDSGGWWCNNWGTVVTVEAPE